MATPIHGDQRQANAGRLTYAQALEVIGRYFDQQDLRGIFVAETTDGFVAKARPAAEPLEAPSRGFAFRLDDLREQAADERPEFVLVNDAPPLCPYGYGVFMRLVGDLCDRNHGSLVSLLEMANGFVLSYTHARDGVTVRRRKMLDRKAIDQMAADAEEA